MTADVNSSREPGKIVISEVSFETMNAHYPYSPFWKESICSNNGKHLLGTQLFIPHDNGKVKILESRVKIRRLDKMSTNFKTFLKIS